MAGQIGVIGAGGWGTALAMLLCKKGEETTLWCHGEETFRIIQTKRENQVYLPGISLLPSLKITRSLEEAVSGKKLLFCALPSHAVRDIIHKSALYADSMQVFVCGTKGLEEESLLTMGQVLSQIFGNARKDKLTFLSGPSFALEVARELPTALTLAAFNEGTGRTIQKTLSTQHLRIYTSHDIVGVQIGGVVKNVIAIAAGISDGLALGNNARSALITRGLAEMTRLANRMGGDDLTLSGLPGLGDLVLTCTGDLSRNRSVGMKIAQGYKLDDIQRNMKMIAEGVKNTRSVYLLASRLGVEMPIVEIMYQVLYEDKNPMEGVRDLMKRTLKAEIS